MASTYDGDGNRAFQLNYNPDAECGYGKNVNGEIFMPEHSHNEDGSLTAEGELFGYICSATGRAYDLTEYVNDTNREHTEVLTAFNINTGFDTESYTYAGSSRLSRNNIWNEARDVNHDEMSYYLYDGQGSVTANTWYNGMVTDVYQYDPYGRMELGGEGHTDFYGYRAESYNPNTGLEYLRARYYNADKGRFFQEDTYLGDITDPLTLNRYAYVKNSPLNYADPSGHVAEYLTGPQYNPDDGWQANHYLLSQTGPEKTEFPIEIDAGKSWADFGKQIVNLFDEHGGAMAGAATGVAIAVFLLPGAGAVILVGSALITGGAGYIVGGVSDSELKKADIRKALREQGIEIDKENIAIETLHEQMEKLS